MWNAIKLENEVVVENLKNKFFGAVFLIHLLINKTRIMAIIQSYKFFTRICIVANDQFSLVYR